MISLTTALQTALLIVTFNLRDMTGSFAATALTTATMAGVYEVTAATSSRMVIVTIHYTAESGVAAHTDSGVGAPLRACFRPKPGTAISVSATAKSADRYGMGVMVLRPSAGSPLANGSSKAGEVKWNTASHTG